MRLGAHMRIAGGFGTAVREAVEAGCEALQIFTKSPQQWARREVTEAEGQEFQRQCAEAGIYPVIAHDSYLINMASADEALRRKSVEGFISEVWSCHMLGVKALVTHMGSAGKEPMDEALERLCASLDEVLAATADSGVDVVLETTAGQGNSLGSRFEEFPRIFDRVKDDSRLGVCLDTCHIFVAGYDIRTREGYEEVMAEFDRLVGIHRLRAIHLNDAKKALGSRVDRHEQIGQGMLGLDAFRWVVNDPRLQHLPGILETPKLDAEKREMDPVNLALLRSLMTGPTCPT
ncbi:MAG TPA: deoxyribonuclease IV [Armatimonadota bacterium]|nr:deoxyribonuclease IV [Armatimonadota bacterium]HOJ20490.1 deoxyribonuclease IV [Armatimonadota bacterium]HOM82599.1 deoxyribonuclease IV [Armatimonadota bacterium]HPO72980.1 deoxyribonuclease IV [Armatimonadota bacterium]HPT97567.1 deoxyribonuclease IV [Armatimonadota bacterium]